MKEKSLIKRNETQPAKAEEKDEALVFIPHVDILETESAILLKADMPGVDASSVDIALEGQELTITGNCLPKAPEGYSKAYEEYQTGNYEREFTLGDIIDRDHIKASVKDGILSLMLPKVKEELPRRIAVKTG